MFFKLYKMFQQNTCHFASIQKKIKECMVGDSLVL